tara:strand:+ start:379 stop:1104 length:726 start_codon:yes stop_codon:yes gene_type:complete
MFFMNKRGVLTTYLLIFVIIAVGTSLFLFTGEDIERYFILGESQMEVLDTYALGEKDLFVYEENMKISLSDSILELANTGGVLNRASVEEYSYWQRGNKKCYPGLGEIKNNLKTKLAKENLDYSAGKIIVSTMYNKEYELNLSNSTARYNVNTTSTVKYLYDLDAFVNSIQEVKRVIDECGTNTTCWESRDVSFESLNEGNTFKIEVTSQNMKDILRGRNIVLKGAVDFEYNPLEGGVFEC